MAADHRAHKPENCRVNGFRHGWIWGPKGCPYISPLGFAQGGFTPWPKGWTWTNRTVTHLSYNRTRDVEPDQYNQPDPGGSAGSPRKRRSFFSWAGASRNLAAEQRPRKAPNQGYPVW